MTRNRDLGATAAPKLTNDALRGPTSPLPSGWTMAALGDVCLEPQYGWTTSAATQGSVHLLRTSDITAAQVDWSSVPFCSEEPADVNKYLLKDGDIVISRAGSVGYSRLVERPKLAVFASYLIRFRPLVYGRYVAFFLRSPSYWDFISERTLGIAIPNVNASKLREAPIPIAPLAEQQRIVAKIEELLTKLDAGVAALKRAQAKLKRYRASVLKAACEGRLVPQNPRDEPASELLKRILAERRAKWEAERLAQVQPERRTPKDDTWREKYEGHFLLDAADLTSLPQGWTWATLSQLGDVGRGKSKHRPRDDHRLFGGPYPFIQTGDVRNSGGRITRYTQTYSEFGLAQSRLWPIGTLCITIAANIADTGILTFPCCLPDSIVGFVARASHCDVRFIELFVRTAKETLERYAPATAQKNINLAILEKLAVPLPPLLEQHRIVTEVARRFSVVDEVVRAIRHNLALADRLRQSILKEAFEGKLVPQDPNDEPAEMLLERIKCEMAMREPEGVPPRIRSKQRKRTYARQLELI